MSGIIKSSTGSTKFETSKAKPSPRLKYKKIAMHFHSYSRHSSLDCFAPYVQRTESATKLLKFSKQNKKNQYDLRRSL